MRRYLLIALPVLASLAVFAGTAQAVVVDVNPAAHGQLSVAYSSDQDQGSYYGVALLPGTFSHLAAAGVPTVSSSAPCTDPALTPDLTLPNTGLCSHGGAVLHATETFAVTWDGYAQHRYWEPTT